LPFLFSNQSLFRFKYRSVESNDFGLETTEVLSAPDKELNAWCSLKKTCQYRTEEEEKGDVIVFGRKGKSIALKKKILPSLFAEDPPEEVLKEAKEKKAAKGKKKRKVEEKEKEEEVPKEDSDSDKAAVSEENDGGEKKKSKKKKKKSAAKNAADASDEKKAGESKSSAAATAPAAKKQKKESHKAAAAATASAAKKNKNSVNAQLKMQDSALEAYQINVNQFKRKARKMKYKEK
jgi:protein KRI1